jgi:hypothetical protein
VDALAATVQPLILTERTRQLPWVNVYSRWDPIGGALDYYDRPGPAGTRRVINVVDPDATTPFLAHLEHWTGRRVFRELLERLPSLRTHAWRGSAETSDPQVALPDSRAVTGLLGIHIRWNGA